MRSAKMLPLVLGRTLLCLAALPFGAALTAAPAGAQPATLVRDIDPGLAGEAASSSPGNFFVLGQKLVFTAEEPGFGRELWATDGTAAGTAPLADLCPGECSAFVVYLGGSRKLLYFASAGALWRTDGTPAGTFALPASPAGPLVRLGEKVLFFNYVSDQGLELWTSDGTAAGTRLVTGAWPSDLKGSPLAFFAAGDRVFFLAPSAVGLPALWVSDGTAAGTAMVFVIPAESAPRLVTATAGRVFFVAEAGGGEQLWTSDFTAAGTYAVTRFTTPSPFAATQALVTGATGVYFAADAGGTGGLQVWKSDGTRQGTVPVTAFTAEQPLDALDPARAAEAGGRLVLAVADGTRGAGLWATAGSPASFAPLGRMVVSRYTGLLAAGGRVFFRADDGEHGYEPWATDGTAGGTAMLRDICPGPCDSPVGLPVAVPGGVAFLARDPDHGTEVWTSDGTSAGTVRWTDLPADALDPLSFTAAVVGGRLFFPAADFRGEELWVAGPGAEGGRLVADIAVAGSSSFPLGLTALGDRLLFTACDGVSREVWGTRGTPETSVALTAGSDPEGCGTRFADRDGPHGLISLVSTALFWSRDFELWVTDGTSAGTVPSPAQPTPMTSIHTVVWQSRLLFPVASGDMTQMWTTDGTAAGTRRAFDLPADVGSYAAVAAVGADLYFGLSRSGDETGGLYRRDGGTGTIALVSPEPSFQAGPAPPAFLRAGGWVFFVDDSGRIWRTDGTPAGTSPIPAQEIYPYDPFPTDLTELGGDLYFFATLNGGNRGLLRTDNTGTVLLAKFPIYPSLDPETREPRPAGLTVAAGRLFFAADDGIHGRELWTSDGTIEGTSLLADLYPGPQGSSPSSLVAAFGRLYFAAADPVHGRELWSSDGTAAGTLLVQDLAPGALSSAPDQLTVAGGRLYFTADDGATGRELWSLSPGAAGCTPSATRLCLLGGRFAVTAEWRDFAGSTGEGHALALTADTGAFWFFAPGNLEVAIKVIDGRALNQSFWVFYGALTDVEYVLTVTDTATGLTRRYENPMGQFASVGDTGAFGPHGARAAVRPPRTAAVTAGGRGAPRAATGSCVPGLQRLCLAGGRFAVEAAWKDFAGRDGAGKALGLTPDTGSFWFFAPGNVEVLAKVLDGRSLNGHFWFFYGALTDVEYTLTVTDTLTGTVRIYRNPAGSFASAADLEAF
jgi:ELWxxDGT repeat protein